MHMLALVIGALGASSRILPSDGIVGPWMKLPYTYHVTYLSYPAITRRSSYLDQPTYL